MVAIKTRDSRIKKDFDVYGIELVYFPPSFVK